MINIWTTYRVTRDNPRTYPIGDVMTPEVVAGKSGERYLRTGRFVDPVAVQRLRSS